MVGGECMSPNIVKRPRRHQPFFTQMHSCFLQKEKEHNQTITKLDSDLKMAKSNWERQDLLAGKESARSSPPSCTRSPLHSPPTLSPSAVLTLAPLCHRASRI